MEENNQSVENKTICIIGDPHFMEKNKDRTDIMVRESCRLIEERKPDFTVIMGDVFDDGKYPYSGVIVRVIEFIEKLRQYSPVYILVGNHDRPNPKVFLTNETPLEMFKGYRNVTVVDRCHTMVWNNLKICMMPFVEVGRFNEACEFCNIKIMDYDLFFTHQEYAGCKINLLNGEKADKWKPKYPMNIAGHIHDQEIVGDNLVYVGTPYQNGFSESTDKGIYFMETNMSLTKVDLGIPRKIHLKVNITELETLELNPNTEYKLTITGPVAESRQLIRNSDLSEKFLKAKIIYKDTKKMSKTKRTFNNMSMEERVKMAFENDKRLKKVYKKFIK